MSKRVRSNSELFFLLTKMMTVSLFVFCEKKEKKRKFGGSLLLLFSSLLFSFLYLRMSSSNIRVLFPKNANARQRAILHEFASSNGLKHYSIGEVENKTRQIVLEHFNIIERRRSRKRSARQQSKSTKRKAMERACRNRRMNISATSFARTFRLI